MFPVEIVNSKIILPDLHLIGFALREHRTSYESILIADFFLRRMFFFHLTRFYLPAFFVTIASFLPLYLAPNAHSKVALGVTVLLTMVTLVTGNYPQLPKVNSLTALDIYLFFCFLSVFLSVFQYALIGYYELIITKGTTEYDLVKNDDDDDDVGNDNDNGNVKEKKKQQNRKKVVAVKRANLVDCITRKLYPTVFFLFHLVYAAVLGGVVLVQNTSVEITYSAY